MTLRALLRTILGRWKLISIITICLTIAALGLSLVLPETYVARTAVIVDLKAPEPNMARMGAQIPTQSVIQTQIDLIRSEGVARRVVTKLGLDRQAQLQKQWREDTGGKGDFVNYIAKILLAKLDVLPGKDSAVIGIQYSASSPEFAAAIANAFAQAYIDVNLDLKVEPAKRNAGWYDEQRAAVEAQLTLAQRKLAEFQQRNSVLAVSEGQIDVENARLANLTVQLAELMGQKADASARLQQASTQNALIDIENNPVISAIKTEISKTEANVKQLSTQYGSGHPALKAATEQLTALKTQLSYERGNLAKTVTGSSNIAAQREATIRAELDRQKVRVLALKEQTDSIALLKRDVDRAQKTLDAIDLQQSQAALESRMQQNNVSIVSSAVPPESAARPRVFLNTLVGFVFGCLLAMGVALILEARNPIIRNIEDVELDLDIPVISVVSDYQGSQNDQSGTPSLSHRTVLAIKKA